MPDTYKLINATKEEACREAEANAIRAKTGDSQNIDYDFANDKGFADAIAAIPTGGGSLKYATGTYKASSGKTTSITIQHNLNSKKVLVFWIAESDSAINVYSQIFGAYLFREAYVDSGYKSTDNTPLNYIGEDENASIGWQGIRANSNDLTVANRNTTGFFYGTYDTSSFSNDGNSVTIPFNSRSLSLNTTYRWIVLSVDWL